MENESSSEKPFFARFVKENSCKSSGFSLLEVLIAMAISSIAFMALASTSLQVVRGNESSQQILQASLLAQNTIETLKIANYNLGLDLEIASDDVYDNVLNNCSTGNDNYNSSQLFLNPDHYTDAVGATIDCTTPGALAGNQTFVVTWSIQDSQPVLGMKLITVVVGWSSQKVGVGSSSGSRKADNYLTVYAAVQGR